MKQIPLTQGRYAIVDDEDYERLIKHKWYAYKGHRTYYAIRDIWHNGKRHWLPMQNEVLKTETGCVDHVNRKGLDNRKVNLRICTNLENQYNRGPSKKSSSPYKGVSFHKGKIYKGKRAVGKFRASVGYCNKSIHIGHFDTEVEAAIAYDIKAKELFGEFAYLNFPEWRKKKQPTPLFEETKQ